MLARSDERGLEAINFLRNLLLGDVVFWYNFFSNFVNVNRAVGDTR